MTTKRTLYLLLALALLLIPMLACGETGYLPEQDVTVEQAEYTIRVNRCSQECGGQPGCTQECVNR